MGDGRIGGADCDDSAGLVAPLSSLTLICGSGVGVGATINGKFSETLATRRGRKREPPPRNWEIRLSNLLRQSEGMVSSSEVSRGT
jgi:hypothetical protein